MCQLDTIIENFEELINKNIGFYLLCSDVKN
jgi:hypothetical protein